MYITTEYPVLKSRGNITYQITVCITHCVRIIHNIYLKNIIAQKNTKFTANNKLCFYAAAKFLVKLQNWPTINYNNPSQQKTALEIKS